MIGEHEHYWRAANASTACLGWRIRRFSTTCGSRLSRSPGDCDLLIYVANWPSRRQRPTDAARARDREPVLWVGVNRTGRDGNGAS
jgi:hypothetical protein